MCDGGRRAAKRTTNLPKTCLVEPAIPDSAAHGPAVGFEFVGPHMMMAALMVEDEKAHQSRLASDKHRIDDQELGIWHRYSEIWQTRIEHVSNGAALQFSCTNLDTAISFQGNGRRGFHRVVARATTREGCDTTRREQTLETHNVRSLGCCRRLGTHWTDVLNSGGCKERDGFPPRNKSVDDTYQPQACGVILTEN